MKSSRVTFLFTTAFALAAFSSAGCAEKQNTAEAPAAKAVAKTPAPEAAPVAPVVAPAEATPAVITTQWQDIKDCTFDTRGQFFAGLKQLEARLDVQLAGLADRRAAMPSTANTKDWDFAMKEMGNARSYFTAMGEEASKATPETWAQQKDKVGLAWVRTQEAYGKVISSTTT